MNRIDELFRIKQKNILSVYFTAGYPSLESTREIIRSLDRNGADLIEIGMPFSDPLADGPVIQQTGNEALLNGMTISLLFNQLATIREKTNIPLILMGYLNPVLQFGFANFCTFAEKCGIDGLIIPDLPPEEYAGYRHEIEMRDLRMIFLITPDTPDKRIRFIDSQSSGFLYLVSSKATTGNVEKFGTTQVAYFKKISSMGLKNPLLAGFGIHDRQTKDQVFDHLNGAVIGSAYLRALQKDSTIEKATNEFLSGLL